MEWRPGEPLQINWVITPPSEGSGGHTTAFRLVAALEAAGHRCRVHLYDLHASDVAHHEQVIRRCWPDVKAEVASASTGCPTLMPRSQRAGPRRTSSHRDRSLGRRFYLVQDMEPGFYPAGSEAALAEMTYRFGFHGVTAGAWLAKTLVNGTGCPRTHSRSGWTSIVTRSAVGRARASSSLPGQRHRAGRSSSQSSRSGVRGQAHPDVPIHLFGGGPVACPSPRRSRSPLSGRAGRALQQLLGRARAVDDERVARSPRDAGRRMRAGHERRRAQPGRARWRTGRVRASRAASTGCCPR